MIVISFVKESIENIWDSKITNQKVCIKCHVRFLDTCREITKQSEFWKHNLHFFSNCHFTDLSFLFRMLAKFPFEISKEWQSALGEPFQKNLVAKKQNTDMFSLAMDLQLMICLQFLKAYNILEYGLLHNISCDMSAKTKLRTPNNHVMHVVRIQLYGLKMMLLSDTSKSFSTHHLTDICGLLSSCLWVYVPIFSSQVSSKNPLN